MCSTQDTSKIIRTTFHKTVYGKKYKNMTIILSTNICDNHAIQCNVTQLSLAFESEILFSLEVGCTIKEAIALSAWEFETKEAIFDFTFSDYSYHISSREVFKVEAFEDDGTAVNNCGEEEIFTKNKE